MNRRLAYVLFFAASVLLSCDGGQRSKGDGGAGGVSGHGLAGSTHSAGQGGASRSGGSGATDASPFGSTVQCGSNRCTATGTLAACCANAATSTCGVEDKLVGIACGAPAVADPRCPMVLVDLAGTAI